MAETTSTWTYSGITVLYYPEKAEAHLSAQSWASWTNNPTMEVIMDAGGTTGLHKILQTIVIGENFFANATTTRSFFGHCELAASIIFTGNPDTSKVTDMRSMFSDCYALTSLNLSNFNTSKVTNMYYMFSNCYALTSLDLSNFDTSKVTDMSFMFSNCRALTSLNLSNFNTSKVTDMQSMFSNCYALTSLDLSNFDTSKVTYMHNMFFSCRALTSLNLSNFNTSKVTDMYMMFLGCKALTSLDLSNFDTSEVTDMFNMFYGCYALTSLNLSNFNTSKVTDMRSMFSNCYALTSLDLSNFDTSKVTDMSYMFYGCRALTSLLFGPNFIIQANKALMMFGNGAHIPDGTVFPTIVIQDNGTDAQVLRYMFNTCEYLGDCLDIKIQCKDGIEPIDASKVSFEYIFANTKGNFYLVPDDSTALAWCKLFAEGYSNVETVSLPVISRWSIMRNENDLDAVDIFLDVVSYGTSSYGTLPISKSNVSILKDGETDSGLSFSVNGVADTLTHSYTATIVGSTALAQVQSATYSVEVTDYYGRTDTISILVPVEATVISVLENRGVSFGKSCEKDGFTCAFDADFEGGVIFNIDATMALDTTQAEGDDKDIITALENLGWTDIEEI